jgi:hypothetical protein
MNGGAMPQKPPPSSQTPLEKNRSSARGEKHDADKRAREKAKSNGTKNGATVNGTG